MGTVSTSSASATSRAAARRRAGPPPSARVSSAAARTAARLSGATAPGGPAASPPFTARPDLSPSPPDPPGTGSERIRSHLAGADAHRLVDGQHPDLAVADRAGSGAGDDRLDRVVGDLVVDQQLDAGLGQQLHPVLGAPVDLGVPLLAAEAAGLGDGQALDADALQGRLHLVQLERFDDRDNQLHQAESPCGTRMVAGAGLVSGYPAPTGAALPAPPSAKA